MRAGAFVLVGFLGSACRGAGDAPEEHIDRQSVDHSVHAGHVMEPGMVHVAPGVAQELGIRTVAARAGAAASRRRAPATVSYDPARLVRVTTQPGGQVRHLDVPRIGEPVNAGRVLARVYEPRIRAAFEELLLSRGLGEPWASAARQRLRNAGIAEDEIDAALRADRAPETYSVRATVSGIVTARPGAEGSWVSPGGVLVILARAGAVTVEVVTPADHPPPGTRISLSDPGSAERWEGTVEAVLSGGQAAGHAVRVSVAGTAPRVGVPLIAEWETPLHGGVWVPRGAVVDTGERRVVFVATAGGGYTPRRVSLGARTAEEIQVVEGLAAGEEVVAAGTFLLDSETQMTTGGGHAGHGG